jgi:hypothetical protein
VTRLILVVLGVVVLFPLGADGATRADPVGAPFHFAHYGWTGTINDRNERHTIEQSNGGREQTQTDTKQTLSITVNPDGNTTLVGAYQSETVSTRPEICFARMPAFSGTVTTTTKESGTIDAVDKATVQSNLSVPPGYTVKFSVPSVARTVTVTAAFPDCPGYPEKSTFSDIWSIFLAGNPLGGIWPFAPREPGVAHLEGTWENPGTHTGETNTVTVSLDGCGEELGAQWAKRFPADNRLEALKEPFRQHVRNFIVALTKAGAKVRIISVYRPPPRTYLMHYAFVVGYGNTHYRQRDASSIPDYHGSEKVPICWMARPDGTYSKSASIKLARDMVDAYGMNIQHGAAYPSNHYNRSALDMAITWSANTLVVPWGPLGGPHVANAVIDSQPKSSRNQTLWRVGASYGVHKYKSADDPQHWSATGG